MNIARHSTSFEELDIVKFCKEKHWLSRHNPFYSHHFEHIHTHIFRHGAPSIDDIWQGGAKDCIFLSLLSSFVYNSTLNPMRVKAWKWKDKPISVEDIVQDHHRFVHVKDISSGRKYRFKKILPMAWRVHLSNYSRSRTWVRFLEIFMHMKHTAPDNRTFSPVPARGFFKLFGFRVNEDWFFMGQDSFDTREIKYLEDFLKCGPVAVSRNPRGHGFQKKIDVFDNHAYGVLDVNTRDKVVTLFNPLRKEPGITNSIKGFFKHGQEEKAGLFTVNWQEFKNCGFNCVLSPEVDQHATSIASSSFSDSEDDF